MQSFLLLITKNKKSSKYINIELKLVNEFIRDENKRSLLSSQIDILNSKRVNLEIHSKDLTDEANLIKKNINDEKLEILFNLLSKRFKYMVSLTFSLINFKDK